MCAGQASPKAQIAHILAHSKRARFPTSPQLSPGALWEHAHGQCHSSLSSLHNSVTNGEPAVLLDSEVPVTCGTQAERGPW
jgi:hypothetical protein